MKLSVLDQSPIRKGSTAREALQETVALAKLTEELGYTRFWVSEHHNVTSLAGTTPEILIAHLAGQTESIRIGSGGVMLPHYSALKVAENFRMLETLFPGRIDLGMGRAPGGDRVTASLLNPTNTFSDQDLVQQLFDLQNYLNDRYAPGSVQAKVRAMPIPPSVPEQWLLSSSGQSGTLAAHFGMGFSFAHFINPHGGPEAVQHYRARFQPSENLEQPQVNVAIFVFCSNDPETVQRQQAMIDYRFLQYETRGKVDPFDYDDIKTVDFSPAEEARIQHNRQRMIMGNAEEVKKQLLIYADRYEVDELMLVNVGTEFEERLESYRLLAEAFELKSVVA
ncbi:luciferase family oxidoreductase group 1 [Larkinella arboricola]|uniref:Luciferase-like monooxygenase n=1 Tax=Larkinella arboricola TaxID=643671 RepID=A0A327X5R2_LARAB|nr:LLM class flavin-dependent oxidoreductase [Larkinella arboricola]RAK01999.1 luciferase family oxidoreductase group 1 [Larkinella arboricola]